jgi:hypothetical protein
MLTKNSSDKKKKPLIPDEKGIEGHARSDRKVLPLVFPGCSKKKEQKQKLSSLKANRSIIMDGNKIVIQKDIKTL